MTFETIRRRHGGKGSASPVGIASTKAGKKGYVARIILRLDLLDRFSWNRRDPITVALGNGKDRGWLRLSDGDLSGFRLIGGNPRSKQCILQLAAIGDGKRHPTEPAEHKVRNGALYVKLPDWAVPAE